MKTLATIFVFLVGFIGCTKSPIVAEFEKRMAEEKLAQTVVATPLGKPVATPVVAKPMGSPVVAEKIDRTDYPIVTGRTLESTIDHAEKNMDAIVRNDNINTGVNVVHSAVDAAHTVNSMRRSSKLAKAVRAAAKVIKR